jgi:hypothetical protein
MQLQAKRWIWNLLPTQITAQGLGTVITLYVIFLGGDKRSSMVARNSITQLLVMESVQKNLWSWLFARRSIISTLGMLVAMIIGTVGSLFFDLRSYFLICAVSSGTTMVLSNSVKVGSIHIERSSIAHSLHGLQYTISHFHFVFPKFPELYDFNTLLQYSRGGEVMK